MVAPASEMFVKQSANHARIETATLQRPRLRNNAKQSIPDFAAHPMDQWKRKTLLTPVQHLGRNPQAFRQFLQHLLACLQIGGRGRLLRTAHAETHLGRNAGVTPSSAPSLPGAAP